MKKLLIFVVFPVGVFLLFLSGSMRYTLVYDAETLSKVEFSGKEPITAEVLECDIPTDGLASGETVQATFRATLKNHTNRFVVVSAMGEIFAPTGHSQGIHSQMMILSPNATEETTFRSNTPLVVVGQYLCEMRYIIGQF